MQNSLKNIMRSKQLQKDINTNFLILFISAFLFYVSGIEQLIIHLMPAVFILCLIDIIVYFISDES